MITWWRKYGRDGRHLYSVPIQPGNRYRSGGVEPEQRDWCYLPTQIVQACAKIAVKRLHYQMMRKILSYAALLKSYHTTRLCWIWNLKDKYRNEAVAVAIPQGDPNKETVENVELMSSASVRHQDIQNDSLLSYVSMGCSHLHLLWQTPRDRVALNMSVDNIHGRKGGDCYESLGQNWNARASGIESSEVLWPCIGQNFSNYPLLRQVASSLPILPLVNLQSPSLPPPSFDHTLLLTR